MKTHKFKQREIRPLKDDRVPSTWIFTDTETKVREEDGVKSHYFHLGWCFFCEESWLQDVSLYTPHYFSHSASYLEYIDSVARDQGKVVLCGHNIFFDLQASGFFRWFKIWGWQLEFVYDKGLTFILKVVKGGNELLILSTTNFFDCSLKKLGDMISLKKLEVDFDHVSGRLLKKYCYRDTEIITMAMWQYLKFIREHKLGRFCFTKASQALTAYRTAFLQDKIYVHDDPVVHALERSAYMGGRTEAYFIGELPLGNYVTLDINGMYPHVMKEYQYPSKLVGYLEGEPFERYTVLLPGFLMIAECEVSTPEPCYAVRSGGKTVFPVGRFTAFLCTEGIKYGLARGYIKSFIRAAVYLPATLFTGYVDYFKLLRDLYQAENNKVMEKLCKYMHNSLYGKFGERNVVTEKYECQDEQTYLRFETYDMVKGGTWIETYLFGMQFMQHYEGETPHSAPAIAAHITENARMTLWNIIKLIGRGNVIYCDTDSVIIDERHLDRVKQLVDESALGALKIQSRFSELTIDGAKNYRTDAERHIKGIPASAKEVSPGVFEYMHMGGLCMCLKERQEEGVPVETVTRRLVSKYDKGTVTSTGEVVPLIFEPHDPRISQLPPF